MVRHLAMLDCVAVSGSTEKPVIEYVDHLHEHLTAPVRIALRPLSASAARHQRRTPSASVT
jgi:hypothetical protein